MFKYNGPSFSKSVLAFPLEECWGGSWGEGAACEEPGQGWGEQFGRGCSRLTAAAGQPRDRAGELGSGTVNIMLSPIIAYDAYFFLQMEPYLLSNRWKLPKKPETPDSPSSSSQE